MHTKIYIGQRDLPKKNLDKLVRRLRIRGIELVVQPNNFSYAYSSTLMTPAQIMRAYSEEYDKCESEK